MDLQEYMTKGVERIVSDAMKATLKDPKESAFMVKFAASSRIANRKRASAEKRGEHIPPFLIASITSSCNLHCIGCYSRGIETCTDGAAVDQLDASEWDRVFAEAEDMGISFIFLVGGEPLIRPDVIDKAAAHPKIMFPVVTNGTLLPGYMKLLDAKRNIVPVISIEGGRDETDERRGEGIYDKVDGYMEELDRAGIAYGVSITVTKENLDSVFDIDFMKGLRDKGCKIAIYIEYVPVEPETQGLAPGDAEREKMDILFTERREEIDDMLMIGFPGSEKDYGGCLAAGRGFFNINSHGGAEPCPFSPYSDVNVRDKSLREALSSKLFAELKNGGHLDQEHDGGCVLYEKRELVESLQNILVRTEETG